MTAVWTRVSLWDTLVPRKFSRDSTLAQRRNSCASAYFTSLKAHYQMDAEAARLIDLFTKLRSVRIRKKFDRFIKYQKVSVALVITRSMFSRKIWWVKNSNNIGQDFIRRRFNQFAEKFNRIKSKIYGVWNRIAHKASARKYMVRVWFFLSKQPCAQNKFYN